MAGTAAKRNRQSTLGASRDPAALCRERGWGPGTHLVGNEGYGPSVIRITAVGERSILARCLSHGGKPCTTSRETSWVLHYRDWTECDPPNSEVGS